jgi:RNA polymerase sigma factor (sigma-70 family)
MEWDGVHALVHLAKGGDAAAWGRLHAHYRDDLLRHAQHRLGPDWPQKSASDLAQEVWLRAWSHFASFAGGDGDEATGRMLRAWLYEILHNTLANERRADGTVKRKAPSGRVALAADDSAGVVDPPAQDPTPSADLRRREDVERLRDALARLTDPRDVAILQGHFFEGRSLHDLAAELGLTYDQVRYRYHGLLKQLGAELGD